TTNSKIGGSKSSANAASASQSSASVESSGQIKALVQPVLAVTAKKRPAL
ncbi:hypothetical protein AAULR_18566, partial [Lacticaseibacillus rhamnosus MTCC 5462]